MAMEIASSCAASSSTEIRIRKAMRATRSNILQQFLRVGHFLRMRSSLARRLSARSTSI